MIGMCEGCGAPRRPGARFCGQCGRPFAGGRAGRAPRRAARQTGKGRPVHRPLIAGLVVALVAVCACVGILIGMLMVGDEDEPPTGGSDLNPVAAVPAAPSNSEPTLLPLEEVTLTGQVVLPQGCSLQPSELRVLSNVDETAVDAQGAFTTRAVRGVDSSTLAIAANAEGAPVLMRLTRGKDTAAGLEMSATSTARALVLFDYALQLLPPELIDQAALLLEAHPDLPALIQAVEQALVIDPDHPLDGDAHPVLYEQAARITADVLAQIEAEGTLPDQGITGSSSASPHLAYPLSLQAQRAPREYVRVEDDPDHTAPTVFLINASFCYYAVEVDLDRQPWASHTLPRNAIYSALFHWPPQYKYSRPIDPGDGRLAFTFTKRQDVTAMDLILTGFSAALGVPVGQAGRMEHLTNYALGTAAITTELLRTLHNEIQSMKGASYSEIAKRMLIWFDANAVNIALVGMAVVERDMKNTLNQSYVSYVGQFLGAKAAWAVMIGYHSSTLGAIGWSLVYAPDEYLESGIQQNGRYPGYRLSLNPDRLDSDAPPADPVRFTAHLETASLDPSEVTFHWLLTGPDASGAMQVRQPVARDTQSVRQNEGTAEAFFESEQGLEFPYPGGYLVAVQAWDGDQLLAETGAAVHVAEPTADPAAEPPNESRATMILSIGNIPSDWYDPYGVIVPPSYRSGEIEPGPYNMGLALYHTSGQEALPNRFMEQADASFRFERRICQGPDAASTCSGYSSPEEAIANWDGFNREQGTITSRSVTVSGRPGWALEQWWTDEWTDEYTHIDYLRHEYAFYGQAETSAYRYMFSGTASVQCAKPNQYITDDEALEAPAACQQEMDNLIEDIATLLGTLRITVLNP